MRFWDSMAALVDHGDVSVGCASEKAGLEVCLDGCNNFYYNILIRLDYRDSTVAFKVIPKH